MTDLRKIMSYPTPRRPIGVLGDLLMLADELMADGDCDYASWLEALGGSLCRLTEADEGQTEWHLFHQALTCLNRASYQQRWDWIMVVAALRPMIERALERLETQGHSQVEGRPS